MKKIIVALLFLVGWTMMGFAETTENVPAFPGAEGFGRYTKGGRGGKVFHVTTLEDNEEPGSLRYACSQTGPRIIVFDVCGTIFLKSTLSLNNDFCTIAGQTAPGDGVCVADYPFLIRANNVIVRYMRFRLGNRHMDHQGDSFGAIDHKNIIVDHCSMSWAIDECCSFKGNENSTVQWCIIAQSLVNAGHAKGAHGYCGNWGGPGASFAHNLIAHHANRSPRLDPRPKSQDKEHVDMRNNVIYNWGGDGCYGGEAMDVNIVNNYYKPGPATIRNDDRIMRPNIRTTAYCEITEWNEDGTPANGNQWTPTWHRWGHFYIDGNENSKYPEVGPNNWMLGIAKHISKSSNDGTVTPTTMDTIRARRPMPFLHTTTWSAEEAYKRVLAYAGCCKVVYRHKEWKDKQDQKGYALAWDSFDQAMISDTREGKATYTGRDPQSGVPMTAGFINTQKEADEWPQLTATKEEIKRASADRDQDGIPDYYEDLYFKKDVSPNSRCTFSGYTQYTNMDYYLARLVSDHVTQNISTDSEKVDRTGTQVLGTEQGNYIWKKNK